MILYTCQCGFQFWIGKKIVIGPFYDEIKPKRTMTRREWRDQYADCTTGFDIKTMRNKLRGKK